MKTTIEIPDGYTLVKVSDTEYKAVKELPNTWEEFCKNYRVSTESEVYINGCSDIRHPERKNRRAELDKNFLPNYEYAEAILALCQLIQLRDCYNDGWKPDWEERIEKKYVISFIVKKWTDSWSAQDACMFSFKSKELRDKFLENFRDLLDKIKPLYQ